MKTKYIASEDRITVHHNKRTMTIVKENNAYFNSLLEALASNRLDLEEVLPEYVVNEDSIAEYSNGKLKLENGRLSSEYFEVPARLQDLVKEFLDSNLPLQPLIKLCEKLSLLSDKFIRNSIVNFVSAGDVPLTWDGDLVLYARSAWVIDNTKSDWMEQSFTPGATRTGENLPCGTFDWTLGECPDMGRVFDLLVQPQHITSVKKQSVGVSQYLNISALEETINHEERLLLLHTNTNHLGSNVYVREPFSDAQLSKYVTAAFTSQNTSVPQAQPVCFG